MQPVFRRPIAALLVLMPFTLAACGGADASPTAPYVPPAESAVQFKLDASTCVGAGAIDFFLDGSFIGTETLSPGIPSKQYETTPGGHVVSAAVSNTHSLVWPSTNVTVQPNTALVWILRCS
jgi:hypothetical protein